MDCEQVVLKGFVLGTGNGTSCVLFLQPRSTDLDLGTLALPPHLRLHVKINCCILAIVSVNDSMVTK